MPWGCWAERCSGAAEMHCRPQHLLLPAKILICRQMRRRDPDGILEADSERRGQVAVDAFTFVLDTHKWVVLSSGSARARRGAPPPLPPNPNLSPAEAARGEAAPPYALMDHAPLATLTNGLLGAMNELRHCAPLALAAPCAQTLQVVSRPTTLR